MFHLCYIVLQYIMNGRNKIILLLIMGMLTLETTTAFADPGTVDVSGYFRSNGTWVAPYIRTAPDGIPWNNFSYHGGSFASAPAAAVPSGAAALSHVFSYLATFAAIVACVIGIVVIVAVLAVAYVLSIPLRFPFHILAMHNLDNRFGRISICLHGIWIFLLGMNLAFLIITGYPLMSFPIGVLYYNFHLEWIAYVLSILAYPFVFLAYIPYWLQIPLWLATFYSYAEAEKFLEERTEADYQKIGHAFQKASGAGLLLFLAAIALSKYMH